MGTWKVGDVQVEDRVFHTLISAVRGPDSTDIGHRVAKSVLSVLVRGVLYGTDTAAAFSGPPEPLVEEFLALEDEAFARLPVHYLYHGYEAMRIITTYALGTEEQRAVAGKAQARIEQYWRNRG